MNILIINMHAPTENMDEIDKDDFYDEPTKMYDDAPGNMIKIVDGDYNSKIRREISFILTMR